MKLTPRRLSVLVCVFALMVPAALGQETAEIQSKVLPELMKAMAELEAHYAKVNGKGSYFKMELRNGVRHYTTAGFEFSKNQERLKVATTDRVVRSNQRVVKTVASSVLCYSPGEFFYLGEEGRKSYRVIRQNKPPDRSDRQTALSALGYVVLCPFSAEGIPLSFLWNRGRFMLVEETPVESRGKKLVRLRFVLRPEILALPRAPGVVPYTEFSVLVSPEERYVVYGFSTRLQSPESPFGDLRSGRVEYEGNHEGFPVPKRVTTFYLYTGGGDTRVTMGDGSEATGRVYQAAIYVLGEMSFKPEPESGFTLDAFRNPKTGELPLGAEPGGKP